MTIKLGELTGSYRLDTADSRIGFVVPTAFVATVGGQFDDFQGTAEFDGDDPSNSSVRVTIRTKSIQTNNARRDNHLRLAFLHVTEHPTITFMSTKVEQQGEGKYEVTGDLAMHGLTKPVTVVFELSRAKNSIRFAGRLTISRREWGVRWNAVGEAGGFMVGDRVTVELDVAAVRRQNS
jgi:polyisoprenoid-binding protein YceI